MYNEIMKDLAKKAEQQYGELKEVVFYNGPKNSLLVFSKETIPSRELSGMLTFGYSGTGSTCYSIFLSALGFKKTDVSEIKNSSEDNPIKLNKNGDLS